MEQLPQEVTNRTGSYWPLLVGPFIGFCSFCIGLITMEGVMIRKDSEGNKQLRFDNVWQYLKLPFDSKNYEMVWGLIPGISMESRLKLLNLNWVAMVGIGAIGSCVYWFVKN